MTRITAFVIIVALVSCAAFAQQPASASGQKSLASTLNVYAFPQKGQSPSQQSEAEAACYNWAVQNTGTDPFQLQKQSQQQAAQTEQAKQQAAATAGQGTMGKEVVKTAAVGTLIGGISGNEGKGAAYGAAVGVMRGAKKQQAQKQQAVANTEAQGKQAQQATAAQVENFKKAFTVCLEGKGYMVKY